MREEYSLKKAGNWQRDFNSLVLEVIDESLMGIGGDTARIIYYYLEKKYVKKRDIPSKIEKFSACLSMIFGGEAGQFIETLIMKAFNKRIDGRIAVNGYTLKEYIEKVRGIFSRRMSAATRNL